MKNLRQFTMGTGYRNTGFYVRGTGHFIIDRPERDKFADYCEIFWCIGGCALFYDDKREFRVTPGMVWFYPKNSFHHIIPSPFINYRLSITVGFLSMVPMCRICLILCVSNQV